MIASMSCYCYASCGFCLTLAYIITLEVGSVWWGGVGAQSLKTYVVGG
jgi:hypothetical protein